MIRGCDSGEFDVIWQVINDSARIYHGAIPQDCWHAPYMREEELQSEIEQGVKFFAYEEQGQILAVMGLQRIEDVSLIRHAYVRIAHQRQGIGGKLLSDLMSRCTRPVLVGTWAAATWAIHFYEKHGFELVDVEEKVRLLKKYWSVPIRQIEVSVVLIYDTQSHHHL